MTGHGNSGRTGPPSLPVMVFAAGLGTRMGALTRDRPKPLIEVAGKALIDHALELAEASGADPIVVNLHYYPDLVRSHLSGRNILFSDETETLLETGGGLREALPLLGKGPVITFNSDAVWSGPNPVTMLMERWDPEQMDALLLLVPSDRAWGHKGGGDFDQGADGVISRGTAMIYSGAQVLKVDALHDIPEQAFSLNLVWDRMLPNGRVYGLVYPGRWCDVGTPEGIATAEKMLGAADDV